MIGFDRPFVMIGERINPTGRKRLAAEMAAGDFSTVLADAVSQVEAGAHMLDVNAGIPLADEPAILAEAVRLVGSVTDVPLCIDSSIVEALEAGLAAYEGKALVNSVTGEEERLERVLPLVAKHGAAVVAISNDETGISEDPDVRFAVAKRIVERAEDHGIARSDVVVDPLVMPVGAMGTAGQQVFRLVRRLHEELGVNTTCGASNIAFGLPHRHSLSAAFISMAAANGMTSAIVNVMDEDIRRGVAAADVLLGHDPDCGRGSGDSASAGADDGRRRRGAARWRREARRARPRASRERPGRGARRLHALGQARIVRGRHERAGGGARPRRRPRFGLRWARDLRPLPGRRERGLAREARDRSTADHLTAFSAPEALYRERRGLATERRLGCHARMTGDLVIDVPPESQLHRQVVRKEADARQIELDPVVRLHHVEVEPPSLASPSGDLRDSSRRSSANGALT